MNRRGEEPNTGLGAKFWIAYLVAEAAVVGGFAALLVLYGARMTPLMTMVASLAIFLTATGMGLLPRLLRERKGEPKMRAPERRYTWRLLGGLLVHLFTLFGAMWVYNEARPEGLMLVLTALAPAAPLLFVVWAMMRAFHEQTDDYQRARMTSSFVWATAFTLAVCTVWGFLETFRLVPHVPMWAVFPLFATGLIPAQVATHFRFERGQAL